MSWVDRFTHQNKESLISRWTAGIDRDRHAADSPYKYELFFGLIRDKIAQYLIEARDTFNMDEKGFMIGMLSRCKRVFNRPLWESRTVRQAIQDGSRDWVSLIACICADGSCVDPALIYPSTVGNLQDTWLEDFDPSHHQAFFSASESGWSNNQIGLAWLQQDPASYLSTSLNAYAAASRSRILDRFDQSTPADRGTPDSDNSGLSASNWRKIDRRLRALVDIRVNTEAQKLSSAIHHISIQNQLLRTENKGLREALVTKKRRSKKGRPLPLDRSNSPHGEAQFWSPHNVQRARDLQQQKDAEEAENQRQKADRAEARKANQQLKARLAEERRATRTANREKRA
ncbi:hypothetical protein BU23DRAFT_563725 [Bimuria novae-zelandiae CBS 107.79]|uniref:DDE-1 domain-containing protein n=1 Tax=Bimuria novae-zelandiae CBS 107.79 TaxID=1447943 RepID=A0A6A5VQ01_9PLEO|nr:hypothetical protein BU23DRAFT_563725 [Bimuria novae-zelandiae CBS 107.79]